MTVGNHLPNGGRNALLHHHRHCPRHRHGRLDLGRGSELIPQYLTASEVAAKLHCDENWVYEHAASGDLPSVKIDGLRRFPEDGLLAWINEHSEGKGLAEVRELRSVS